MAGEINFGLLGPTAGYADVLAGQTAVMQQQQAQQRNQLLAAQQQLAAQKARGEQAKDDQNAQLGNLVTYGAVAERIKQLPQDQRARALQSYAPALTGVTPQQLAAVDLSDAGLDAYISQGQIANARLNPAKPMQPTELMRNLGAAGIAPGTPEFAQIAVANAGAAALPNNLIATPQGIQQIPGTLTQEQVEVMRDDRDARRQEASDSRFLAGLAASDRRAAQQIAAQDRRFETSIGIQQRREDRAVAEVEAKAREQAVKAERAFSSQQAKARNIVGKIDSIIPRINATTAGWGGSALSRVPGTSATDIRSDLETVKANLGFQELQAMRDASPTGGALGAIAVQELIALQSTVASLDASQSPDQLRRNLQQVRQHYGNWLNTVKQAATDARAAPQSSVPQGWSVRVR